MYFFSPPGILKWITPDYIHWSVEDGTRKIYLTFDDGPNQKVTPQVLRILEDFEARATFFCLGKNAEQHPDILENIMLNGHCIGNHTYSHVNAWRLSAKDFLSDVAKCNEVFRSSLFRPPFGNLPLTGLKELAKEYKIIMWSLMSYDFDKRVDPDIIVSRLIRLTKPGSVWVFHDSTKAMESCLIALPRLMEYFMKQGFTFEKIDAEKLQNVPKEHKKKAASARGNGIEDKREIGEIFRGYRNSQ